jgi:hypothetical protein
VDQTRDARRVDMLRRYYVDMQGRRRRPIGFFLLALSVLAVPSFAEWCPIPEIAAPVIGLVGLFVAVWRYRIAGERYGEEFGCIAEGILTGWSQTVVWACVFAPVIFTIGEGLADPGFGAKLFGVATVGWIALYWSRTVKMWPHSVAIFALLAATCLLTVEAPTLRSLAAVELAALGVVLVLGGEIEHRKPEKMLGPRQEEG